MSAELQGRADHPRILFRAMRLDDTPAVMAVERASYDFPWTEGIFRDCIKVGYVCRVVELAGEVVGYAVMTLGAGEAHLLNICVRSDLRRRGVGRRLLRQLIDYVRGQGGTDMFLEVRPSNPAAISAYESMGFVRIGERRGYYQAVGGREDAWVYRLAL